jgi:hypothetical protein
MTLHSVALSAGRDRLEHLVSGDRDRGCQTCDAKVSAHYSDVGKEEVPPHSEPS